MDQSVEAKGSQISAVPLDSKKIDFLENFIQKNIEILNEKKHTVAERKKPPNFQCKFCLKHFACGPSVSRHRKICPLNENAKKEKTLVCHLCNNTFSRIDGLKVHMKRCSSTALKKYKNCLYQNCNVKFYHKQALMQHLTNSHGQVFQKEIQKVFLNEQSFYAWKERTEESTFSYFSKKNGKKANIQYFYCQQDGESRGAERKTARKNSKGQIRSGKTCIASMKVIKLKNDAVLVKFQPMHCHVLKPEDLKHHPLSKNTYSSINEQLSMGLSPKQIIKTLDGKSNQNSDLNKTPASKKNDFVTVHRIQGIARLRRVKLRSDPDDFVSLTKMIEKFKDEPSNPFILFKVAEGEVAIGPAEIQEFVTSSDLFLLGIQTPEQQRIFAHKAGEILSINVAYGTNRYDYPLLTITVPDEYHRGYPVAHFVSNLMDVNSLICFFLALKQRNSNVEVTCIITNDDPVLYEATETVFGTQFRHLLCLWHVNLTFQNYLNSLVPVDHREEMFTFINLLISSTDEEWFINMFDNFVSTYKEISPEFIEIFEKYRDTALKWAMAYRNFPHGNIDTVLLNEAFTNRLKATCTKKKANWRLDDLTTLLLEIEQDDFDLRIKENCLNLPFGLDDAKNSRHVKGLEIPNKDVTEQFSNQWTVMSQTSRDKKYFVSKCNDTCECDPCPFICKDLLCYKLCVHLYFCTCTDKSPLCKHIHKVHSLLTKIITIPADGVAGSSFSLQEENVTLYEENIAEAETIIEDIQVFETAAQEISEPELINFHPFDMMSLCVQDEVEICSEEENRIEEEEVIEESSIDLILPEEHVQEDKAALIEEIEVFESESSFPANCSLDETNSIRSRIAENISKLNDMLQRCDVSDDFLNHAQMSLQNLLQMVESQR